MQFLPTKIAIAADHAGYQLKDSLKRLLDEMGVTYQDFGTSNGQSVDYPDFARQVAEGVAKGQFDRGILVCGTGVGMAIAANKVPGISKQSELFTDPTGHGKGPILILTAYCNYACITGRSPVGLKVTEKGVSDELNALLQRLAWETVTAYTMSGVKAPK